MAQYTTIINYGKFYYKDAKMEILHREDGPAIEWADGSKSWYLNGELHREGGPAAECANGTKEWYRDGKRHREDGPAVEYADAGKSWYKDGELHREGGPAIEYANGDISWYLNGEYLSEAEFLRRTQPAKELTVAEIEKLMGHRVKVIKE
jgi:antitoxin component YwqK of YwqJK toxin-antitoxin module